MKWLLLIVMTACVADEVEQPPPDESFHAKAAEIVALMNEVHDSLRGDMVHKTVQTKGKEIEDKLDKLIEEIELDEEGDGTSDKNGKRPDKDSKLSRHVKFDQNDRAWLLSDRAFMAGPPKSCRDGIIQVYRAELPLRWRQRIAAYFVSIAADEALREQAYRK